MAAAHLASKRRSSSFTGASNFVSSRGTSFFSCSRMKLITPRSLSLPGKTTLYFVNNTFSASPASGASLFARISLPSAATVFVLLQFSINVSISARFFASIFPNAACSNSVRVSLWISSISSRYKISFSLPVSGSSARDSSKCSSSSARRVSVSVGSDSFLINPLTTSRTREVSLL